MKYEKGKNVTHIQKLKRIEIPDTKMRLHVKTTEYTLYNNM